MGTMYDDGFDLMAPPEPPIDLQDSKPAKLMSEEDHHLLWCTPIVLCISTVASFSIIYLAYKLISAALK